MRGPASVAAALAFAALLSLAACRPSAPPGASAPTPSRQTADNLLLITIDTLRADHVGAYGATAARTPAMDAAAAAGVRFDQAFAAAPITLTSHASLLTGRYPPGHGARNNGMRMRAVPTLATLLHARQFATGAFVAAFPLDRRFGLADGFGTYSDFLPRGGDGRPLDERPARVVADEAIAWIQARGAGRFFAWVHFFEPHAPYGSPGESGGRPPQARYDDEVAVADREAGRVIAALGPRAASTLVVITGDHGESFGEHGEVSHSIFVYDTTLRVPLIMTGPGLGPSHAAVVRTPVSLVDVAPTVLAALGIPPADTDGIDLRPVLQGGGDRADRLLYGESFAPLCDYGWSSLRTVRSGRWKYIAAPVPELYDLASDPGETRSVVSSRPEIAAALDARAARFSPAELPAGASSAAAVDPDAARRLRALGYVSTARATTTRRADPKDRKRLARDLALVFSSEVQGQALEDTLASILREDPGNAQAHLRLGYVLLGADRCSEAEPNFRAAVQSGLVSADPWLGLASCAGRRNDLRGAEAALRRADAVEPGNPVVAANLGILLSKAGRTGEAVALLARVVHDDPQFDEARFNLALAYARGGQRAEALSEAQELLRRLPPTAPQRGEVGRLVAALTQ